MIFVLELLKCYPFFMPSSFKSLLTARFIDCKSLFSMVISPPLTFSSIALTRLEPASTLTLGACCVVHAIVSADCVQSYLVHNGFQESRMQITSLRLSY